MKGYCVLDNTGCIEGLLRARLYCLLKGYCVLDYTVSIERLLRARLYCVY